VYCLFSLLLTQYIMTAEQAIQGAFDLVSNKKTERYAIDEAVNNAFDLLFSLENKKDKPDHSDCEVPDDNQGDYNNYDIWKDSQLEWNL